MSGTVNRSKGLIQRVDQVVNVLDSDGKTNRIRQNSARSEFGFAELRVRRSGRMNRERLYIGDIGQIREDRQAVDEFLRLGRTALHAEGEDRAGIFGKVSFREFMICA